MMLLLGVPGFGSEPKLVGELFLGLNCEDTWTRMDIFGARIRDDDKLKLFFVYYRGRFRYRYRDNKELGRYIQWEHSHRDDVTNHLKTVRLYLQGFFGFGDNRFADIDGGPYHQSIIRVWVGRKNSKPPVPSLDTIPPESVEFKAKSPWPVIIDWDCGVG